jgi:hypothetical protein
MPTDHVPDCNLLDPTNGVRPISTCVGTYQHDHFDTPGPVRGPAIPAVLRRRPARTGAARRYRRGLLRRSFFNFMVVQNRAVQPD